MFGATESKHKDFHHSPAAIWKDPQEEKATKNLTTRKATIDDLLEDNKKLIDKNLHDILKMHKNYRWKFSEDIFLLILLQSRVK